MFWDMLLEALPVGTSQALHKDTSSSHRNTFHTPYASIVISLFPPALKSPGVHFWVSLYRSSFLVGFFSGLASVFLIWGRTAGTHGRSCLGDVEMLVTADKSLCEGRGISYSLDLDQKNGL